MVLILLKISSARLTDPGHGRERHTLRKSMETHGEDGRECKDAQYNSEAIFVLQC